MVAHKHHFTDCEILHFLTLSENKFFDGQAPSPFRHQALFVGKSIRQAVNEGKADYIPISLSDIPKLVKSGRLRIDVALLQVSPPAKFGFCSLGINVDINRTVFECAKTVIAQINPLMPRASGDSFVRFADIDYYVEHEAPLLEFSYPETASAPVFTAGWEDSLISPGAPPCPNAANPSSACPASPMTGKNHDYLLFQFQFEQLKKDFA